MKGMKTVEQALEEILHPVIRMYLLMESAAVPAQTPISIMSMCKNTKNYEVVAKVLRQSVGEKKLMTLNAPAPKKTFRDVANFGVTAEDEYDEPETEEFGGDETALEVHENWWDEDQLEEIDKDTIDNFMSDNLDVVSADVEDPDKTAGKLTAAKDVSAQQTRSFAEARDMVRRMRVLRRYYPISRSPAFERSRSKGRLKNKNGKSKEKATVVFREREGAAPQWIRGSPNGPLGGVQPPKKCPFC